MDQPPKESRAPINLRIKFRSESIDQFIERYSIDVSRGGIFIRTREPLAVGTQLKFDFQLQDSSALMAGEGTVVWIREYDANRTGITPGMGVRFDKLTPASQPILEKILAEKGRRDQAASAAPSSGGIMSKVGAGMAVRRPSSTFTALDPRAVGVGSPHPVAPAETPPTGLSGAGRRERRGSPQAPAKIDQAGIVTTVERTNQGFAPSAATAIERTSLGGFAAPNSGGPPPPMTLPNAVSQRPRTPGALPTLESTGSGRVAAGSDVPSLVSRLTGSRPATYEPPTSADIDRALDGLTGAGSAQSDRTSAAARPTTAKASADQGIPSLNDEDDSVSEPTKTGDALSDYFGAAPTTGAVDLPDLGTSATAASQDGVAVPVPTSDSDRTVATPLEAIAEALAHEANELAKEATALERTAKDLIVPGSVAVPGALPTTLAPTSTPDTPPPELKPATPALVLIRNESGPVVKDDAAPFPGEDKHAADEPTPVVDGSSPWSMSPAPAEAAAPPSSIVSEAGRPMSAAGVVMTTAAPVAKGGTARPAAARKSPIGLVVLGLAAVAAVIFVMVSRQGGGEHAQEAFRQPSSIAPTAAPAAPSAAATPTAAQEPAAPVAAAGALPAGSAAPAEPATAATPPPAPEATKVAEAVKPAEVPAAAEAPPATRSTQTTAPSVVRVERGAGGTTKAVAAPARKTVVASAPIKKAAAVPAAVAATESATPPSPPTPAGDQVEPGADLTVPSAKSGVQHLLKVTSTPAGAEVLIDGQSVGRTPFQGNDVDADAPHAVTIKLDGYETHEHMISASDWQKAKGNQETARVTVKLRKMAGSTGTAEVVKKGEAAGAAETTRSETEPKAETKTEMKAPEKATEPPAVIEPPKQKDEAANAAPGK